jgi:hypothetical protein
MKARLQPACRSGPLIDTSWASTAQELPSDVQHAISRANTLHRYLQLMLQQAASGRCRGSCQARVRAPVLLNSAGTCIAGTNGTAADFE